MHFLFVPSLCTCSSAFFRGPHVLAPWIPADLPGPSSEAMICISVLLVEIENDTFVSAYADDLRIARSALNKDVIIAS